MGNDQSSRNCSSPQHGGRRGSTRRRPSDAVARVSLPTSSLDPLAAHFSPTAKGFEAVSRRLNAFRSERPKSSVQLTFLSGAKAAASASPLNKSIQSIQHLQQHRPSLDNNSKKLPSAASNLAHKSQKLQTAHPQQTPTSTEYDEADSNPSLHRGRRMSVAGSGDEAIRRELARAEGESGASDACVSGSSTPQRRFSRVKLHHETPSIRRASRAVEGHNECSGGKTIAEYLRITSYQSLMMQQSWTRIKANAFASVFKDLASKNSVAKELLQKITIVDGFSYGPNRRNYDQKEHIRLLVDLFDFAISQKCTKIGEVHFIAFGTANEGGIWEDLGETLTQAIARADAARGKREAFRAWISLISFLVDSMKAGYVKMFKRKSLSARNSACFSVITVAADDEIIGSSNYNQNNTLPKGIVGIVRSRTPTPQLSSLQLIH